MRKHPAVPFVNRLCTIDYPIPGTDIVIPKGMRIAIAVSGLQNDPDIYPDPERFDPLRFSKDSEAFTQRNSYYFLPFGEGPRICIGSIFFTSLIINFRQRNSRNNKYFYF